MTEITDQQIAQGLAPYGVAGSELLYSKIRTYIALLLRWNKSTSLTTIVDPQEIVKFHFGESIFAATRVPIQNGRLADLGSGAGLPGIPLFLAVPGLDVTLIESNKKKCAFLSEAIREIGGNDIKAGEGTVTQRGVHCRVFRGRAEELPEDEEKFDFVTARAVGDIPKVLDWACERLNGDGKAILWLGREGMDSIQKNSSWIWRDQEKIPGSTRRFLLVGTKNRP